MSSSTDPPPRRGATLGFALAVGGFVLCDGVALLALGNLVGFWHIDGTVLLWALAAGVACLLGGMAGRRFL